MRTKTLLLTAALSAVSLATAVAQTVYSVNAVGYVNVTVPAGKFALLANPLNQPTNDLPSVLPDAPNNTQVFVFNKTTGGFDQATKRSTGWTGPGNAAILAPGTGFFVKNVGSTDMNITFVGEVPQGTNLTVSINAGFSLISSVVPQQGKVATDLGLPAVNNDQVYVFSTANQSYLTAFTKRASGWTGGDGNGEPTINVAQGFFYKATTATTWSRNFSVNQ